MRQHLYTRIGLDNEQHILEVGCGTGAILSDFSSTTSFGIDFDFKRLNWAETSSQLQCGDAHKLPYADQSFDVIVCHFLLLWVSQPTDVLREMRRVTRNGGYVLALAEPDYGGRVDHPAELAELGQWQSDALKNQGADPLMGRKLTGLFAGSGLKNIETGLMGAQWQPSDNNSSSQSEFNIVHHDLRGFIEESKIEEMRELDAAAWQTGERVLYVPTFYALGQVD